MSGRRLWVRHTTQVSIGVVTHDRSREGRLKTRHRNCFEGTHGDVRLEPTHGGFSLSFVDSSFSLPSFSSFLLFLFSPLSNDDNDHLFSRLSL